jgi:hypothetical protein
MTWTPSHTFTAYTKIRSSQVNANNTALATYLDTAWIANAQISASAGIARSKLASGTASHVLINDGSGVMSSEATLANSRGGTGQNMSASTGVVKVASGTFSASAVGLASSDVSGTLPIANGGTNLTTYTQGDLLYASAANTLAKLAVGTNGQVLKLAAGLPSWASPQSGFAVTSKTADYTATANDDVILVSASGAAVTITLPAAASSSGKAYYIKRTDQTPANAVTIDANGSETIDGATTRKLSTRYEALVLACDGSNWHVLDHQIDGGWQSFTPTGSLSTNSTYTGFWRRDGDSMEVQFNIAFAGDPGTYSSVSVNMPTGYTIDTAKMSPASDRALLGQMLFRKDSQSWEGRIAYSSTSAVGLHAFRQNSTVSIDLAPLTDTFPGATDFANGDSVTGFFRVPISGWEG